MEIRYDRANKAFLIYDAPGAEPACIKFPFVDGCRENVFENEDINNYTFTVYYCKDVKEVDFYNLFVHDETAIGNKKRIGWIIPLSTLITEEEDILTNPHLSCYAFLAYLHLLTLPEFQDVVDYESFSKVVDSHRFSDMCIVITNNTQFAPNNLVRLELSFARFGFYKNHVNYKNTAIRFPTNKRLKLYATGDIQQEDGQYIDAYISKFLSDFIIETFPILKFLYLYQIMEILFNIVLVEKLKALLNDVEQDKGSIRELSDELKGQTEFARWESIEEKARINNLKYEELDAKCNAFLGRTTNLLGHPNSIYQVRNHIIHRFRKVISKPQEIKEICQHFELYLLELLVSYKKK